MLARRARRPRAGTVPPSGADRGGGRRRRPRVEPARVSTADDPGYRAAEDTDGEDTRGRFSAESPRGDAAGPRAAATTPAPAQGREPARRLRWAIRSRAPRHGPRIRRGTGRTPPRRTPTPPRGTGRIRRRTGRTPQRRVAQTPEDRGGPVAVPRPARPGAGRAPALRRVPGRRPVRRQLAAPRRAGSGPGVARRAAVRTPAESDPPPGRLRHARSVSGQVPYRRAAGPGRTRARPRTGPRGRPSGCRPPAIRGARERQVPRAGASPIRQARAGRPGARSGSGRSRVEQPPAQDDSGDRSGVGAPADGPAAGATADRGAVRQPTGLGAPAVDRQSTADGIRPGRRERSGTGETAARPAASRATPTPLAAARPAAAQPADEQLGSRHGLPVRRRPPTSARATAGRGRK